jgi:hypothetical protein
MCKHTQLVERHENCQVPGCTHSVNDALKRREISLAYRACTILAEVCERVHVLVHVATKLTAITMCVCGLTRAAFIATEKQL